MKQMKNLHVFQEDCSKEKEFCETQGITDFPTIIIQDKDERTIATISKFKTSDLAQIFSTTMQKVSSENN